MNFIEVFLQALSSNTCKLIINRFEESPHKREGLAGPLKHGVAKIKDSTDIIVRGQQDDLILNAVESCYYHYCNKYPYLKLIGKTHAIDAVYNLQRYTNDQGFFYWHCEHSPLNPKRSIAWMVYLNDAECGTTWMHQDYTSKAREGDLLIWPASWTHAHKGVTPNIGTKYIATGWIIYHE